MPIEILAGSLEERLLRILMEVYPITVDRLVADLHVPTEQVTLLLRRFQLKGIVEMDPMPDKVFVRLLRRDFLFVGSNPTQRKRFKQKGGPPPKKGEPEGPMYA